MDVMCRDFKEEEKSTAQRQGGEAPSTAGNHPRELSKEEAMASRCGGKREAPICGVTRVCLSAQVTALLSTC